MQIREYDIRYHAKLEHIYLNSRRDAFYWVDTQNYQLSDFSQDTQGEKIWVALQEERVLGFIAVWQEDHFIHHLYVDKSVYRQGVGEKLLQKVRQVYQDPLRLKCLCQNQRAILFYQSQGFVALSEGKDDLGAYLLMQLN
jgi:ribosomal protein S18 acetylase RimI-like enzyme